MQPSRIRVLNDQTINKIAAGEVIEHPASVVKELVENAIDAGAGNICVEIQGGGRQLIRVTDNGCGMARDDAILCLERHATSKIREVEDIQDLLTMGFRGEAIPSIAAISKFSLLTCPRLEGKEKEGEGTLLVVDGGRLLSCAAIPRDPGTTVEVKSLFFNVPVRRKFQKSPAFDTHEILRILTLLSLGYPAIQFELISDQKLLLKTPLSQQALSFHDLLNKRLEVVLGKDFASSLFPLKFQQNPYELEGFIGSATAHKPNRTGQHLFINQRAVYSPLISSAVREGYGTMLPNHRYPIFVLHLRLPGSELDVNVHPQKKEVRLRQEPQLKEAIIRAVQTGLRKDQQPEWKTEPEVKTIEFSSSSPPSLSFEAAYPSPFLAFPKTPVSAEVPWEYKPVIPSSPLPKPAPSLLKQIQTPPKVLATFLGYCLLDPFHLDEKLFGKAAGKREGGLALLDQHAAYARVHYEQLLKNTPKGAVQTLLIPLTLQFTFSESRAIQEYLPLLNEMGFDLREFGENTFLVDAIPPFFKESQLQTGLSLILQDLLEVQSTRRLQLQKEEQLALAACRASLPATKRLSLEEAQGLLQQLMNCNLPAQSPMGKPTCLYLDPEEVSKWFHKQSL